MLQRARREAARQRVVPRIARVSAARADRTRTSPMRSAPVRHATRDSCVPYASVVVAAPVTRSDVSHARHERPASSRCAEPVSTTHSTAGAPPKESVARYTPLSTRSGTKRATGPGGARTRARARATTAAATTIAPTARAVVVVLLVDIPPAAFAL